MKNEFGGSLLKNKRKTMRPLSHNESVHLILRLKPNLPYLFEPHDQKLREKIFKIARKNEIKIYDLIFNHTHLHGVFLFPRRECYVRFIREMTAAMVSYFNAQLSFLGVNLKNIFTHRPYTRSVPWGRAYKGLLNYMKKNEIESGFKQSELNEQLKLTWRILARSVSHGVSVLRSSQRVSQGSTSLRAWQSASQLELFCVGST